MDKYDELMTRREALIAEWMRWVEANRGGAEFIGHGVRLEKSGRMEMVGWRDGRQVLALIAEKGKPVEAMRLGTELKRP